MGWNNRNSRGGWSDEIICSRGRVRRETCVCVCAVFSTARTHRDPVRVSSSSPAPPPFLLSAQLFSCSVRVCWPSADRCLLFGLRGGNKKCQLLDYIIHTSLSRDHWDGNGESVQLFVLNHHVITARRGERIKEIRKPSSTRTPPYVWTQRDK